MRKRMFTITQLIGVVLIFTLLPFSGTASVRAQSPMGLTGEETVESGSAEVAAPVVEEMTWSREVPVLTDEQQAQLDYWTAHTNLSGPERAGSLVDVSTAPAAGSETVAPSPVPTSALAPMAPGDAETFRKRVFGGAIPAGFKSNVMESSVAEAGRQIFFTGNWFAARSVNNGRGFFYVNAYSGFPDFCCDQVTIYDESRDLFLWLRMGVPDANGENVFKLGASTTGGGSFTTYTNAPTDTNGAWTNQWWDYPHMQLGADYLYITWNMFDSGDNFVRTVILRWPLNALAAGTGFSYNYFSVVDWFTFVPVQGADHTMYFASNYPLVSPFNRIKIWRWHEDSSGLTTWTKTIDSWTLTSRGTAQCGTASGNWASRTDDRLLSGARYMIQASNLKYPGRKVLGWWWNVQEGGSFAQPYIDGVAFFEDTMTQVSGAQGRPYVWNSSICFLYPSFAANKRGDLGGILNASVGTDMRPAVYFAIEDDFVTAAPGFSITWVYSSNARPTVDAQLRTWGDYNTTRVFMPGQDTWVAGAHRIPGSSICFNCSEPIFVAFGRGRDYESWNRWRWR